MATFIYKPIDIAQEPEEYLLALTRTEALALRSYLNRTPTPSPTDTIFNVLCNTRELNA